MQELEQVSSSLEENKAFFQEKFKNAMDFMLRELELSGTKAALIALDGLVSKQVITLSILNPLLSHAAEMPGNDGPEKMKFIEEHVLGSMEQKHEADIDNLLVALMSGFALLFLDGCPDALIFGVQGFATRGPEEPQNEVMQRGAKDGFTESYQNNMAMIRRRMKSTSLKFEKAEAGSQSRTPLALCYLEGVASEAILRRVRKAIQNCDLKTTLGAGYLSAYLEKKTGIFSSVGLTERPDVVCGKIEEGRIAILVEGTPSVLLVPFLFVENFQTLDDYLTRPFYGTFIRWLKYLAFFQRLSAGALCGHHHTPSRTAAGNAAAENCGDPGADAVSRDAGIPAALFHVRGDAGSRSSGAQGPEHHGEYCGRSGHWRYGSFRRACQRALTAGYCPDGYCRLCHSAAV